MDIYGLIFEKVRFPFTGSIYQAEYESDQFRHFMARHPIHPSHAARPISREKFKARQAYEDNKKTESKMEEIRRKMKAKKSINKLPDIKPRSVRHTLTVVCLKSGLQKIRTFAFLRKSSCPKNPDIFVFAKQALSKISGLS